MLRTRRQLSENPGVLTKIIDLKHQHKEPIWSRSGASDLERPHEEHLHQDCLRIHKRGLAFPEIGIPGDWHSWRLAFLEIGIPGDWHSGIPGDWPWLKNWTKCQKCKCRANKCIMFIKSLLTWKWTHQKSMTKQTLWMGSCSFTLAKWKKRPQALVALRIRACRAVRSALKRACAASRLILASSCCDNQAKCMRSR